VSVAVLWRRNYCKAPIHHEKNIKKSDHSEGEENGGGLLHLGALCREVEKLQKGVKKEIKRATS